MPETSKSSPDAAFAASAGGTPCADQLAELKDRREAAIEREGAARSAVNKRRYDVAFEVTSDLVAFREDIAHKMPSATPIADRPARERELTDQFLKDVKDRGLTVAVLGTGGAVALVDPALTYEYAAAREECQAASLAVEKFERDHADDLDAERRKADADSIREALASDDGDAIREALTAGV